MADDLLGDFHSDNNFQSEEFEKVDKIPEQDEEISSSILGEEAEADRYGSGIRDTVDQTSDLLNMGSNLPTFAQNDPFSVPPAPTAPPKEDRDLMSAFEDSTVKSESQPEVPKPFVAGNLTCAILVRISPSLQPFFI